jgi:hypothetical protein
MLTDLHAAYVRWCEQYPWGFFTLMCVVALLNYLLTRSRRK